MIICCVEFVFTIEGVPTDDLCRVLRDSTSVDSKLIPSTDNSEVVFEVVVVDENCWLLFTELCSKMSVKISIILFIPIK